MAITKPPVLDETGKAIAASLAGIEKALKREATPCMLSTLTVQKAILHPRSHTWKMQKA